MRNSRLPDPSELTGKIVDVVRGNASWQCLNDVRTVVKKTEKGWSFLPVKIRPIYIKAEDIRSGLCNLIKDSEQIKEWASFVLAASSLVDLQGLETERCGDELLELMWDLAFGKDVTDEVIRICHLADAVHEKKERSA